MNQTGFSKTRLARMRDVMNGHVEHSTVPGLVSLVSRHGEVHENVIGTQEVGGKVPMRRDTIFRIASMSKPVIAAAAMILVEECKFRLDDPVDRWLPELANCKVLKRFDGPVNDTVPAEKIARFAASYHYNAMKSAFDVYDPGNGQWSRPNHPRSSPTSGRRPTRQLTIAP